MDVDDSDLDDSDIDFDHDAGRHAGLGSTSAQPQQQRDDPILGVFAHYSAGSSDSDDGGAGNRRANKRDKRNGQSSASVLQQPMRFKPSTPTVAKEQPANDNTDMTMSADTTDDHAERPGLSAGPAVDDTDNNEATQWQMRQAAKAKRSADHQQRFRRANDDDRSHQPQQPPQRAKPTPAAVDPKLAAMSGFGAKMLAKMGFKGRLGKNDQGIAAPIEAAIRPTGAGLGAVKERVHRVERSAADETSSKAPTSALNAQRPAASQQWKRNKQQPKSHYKHAAEMLDDTKPQPAKAVIIDMRGGSGVLMDASQVTSAEAAEQQQKKASDAPSAQFLPELVSNLQLLVSQCEISLRQLDSQLQTTRKQLKHIEQQKQKAEQTEQHVSTVTKRSADLLQMLKQCDQQMAGVEQSMQLNDDVVDVSADSGLTQKLNLLYNTVLKVQTLYGQEYQRYNLSTYLYNHCHALLSPVFLSPAYQPPSISSTSPVAAALSSLQRLQTLFVGPNRDSKNQTTPDKRGIVLYERLVDTLVIAPLQVLMLGPSVDMEHIHVSIVSSLQLIKAVCTTSQWHTDVVHQLLLPKLQSALQAWQPRYSAVDISSFNIHQWLVPYIHLLPADDQLTLFLLVQRKLQSALQRWQPANVCSTDLRNLITVWQSLWHADDFNSFVTVNIVPKLQSYWHQQLSSDSKAAEVFPLHDHASSHNDMYAAVADWQALIPTDALVYLYVSELLHPWFATLYCYLRRAVAGEDDSIDFDAIGSWYQLWSHKLMPVDVRQHPVVRKVLLRALDLMNAALEEQPLQAAYDETSTYIREQSVVLQSAVRMPRIKPSTSTSSLGKHANIVPTQRQKQTVDIDSDVTLKDVLNELATRYNLLYQPDPKHRVISGQTVYKFGTYSIYTQNGVIYADRRQLPASMQQRAAAAGGEVWQPIGVPSLIGLISNNNAQ